MVDSGLNEVLGGKMTIQFATRLYLLALTGAAVALVAACSGGTSNSNNVAAADLSRAIAAATSGAGGGPAVSGASGAPTDPCTKLTKADVQPFFTVPIATALPSVLNTATTKGCTWSAADGTVETSVALLVRTGGDASFEWTEATSGNPIKFSGVGDQAEHISGISDFVSIKGGVVCSITTLGRTHLAPLAGLTVDSRDLLSDSDATAVAQQFGTLCNKIYGSGNTTPTATASAADSGIESGAPSSSATSAVSIPAAGGTIAATNFPLPQGLDCTGKVTVMDGDTSCDLTIDSAAGAGIYAFYLSELPSSGYTINHEQTQATSDGTTASILFTGGGFSGLCTIGINGTDLMIDLRS
jgi:hypothetical protein